MNEKKKKQSVILQTLMTLNNDFHIELSLSHIQRLMYSSLMNIASNAHVVIEIVLTQSSE